MNYHLDPNHGHDHNEGEGEEQKENSCETCHQPSPHRANYYEHQKKILDRLNRIEGQIKGIRKMVENDRYCVDILTQVAAARSAMDSLAMIFFEDHTRGCVSRAIKNREGESEIIQELMEVINKFIR